MKKLLLFCLLTLLISNISAIIINEVEMNPEDGSDGKEWIELYNNEDESVDISGWEIYDNVKSRYTIQNGTIIETDDFYVIEMSSSVLNNGGDFVILYDANGNEIDRTETLEDADWSYETHQLCDSSWKFLEATKGEKNNCKTEEEESENTEEEIITEEEDIEESIKEDSEEVEDNITENLLSEEGKEVTVEVIKLNPSVPKNIKSEDDKRVLDKNDYAKYGFVAFCILIGVLLVFKNKKDKNELV